MENNTSHPNIWLLYIESFESLLKGGLVDQNIIFCEDWRELANGLLPKHALKNGVLQTTEHGMAK